MYMITWLADIGSPVSTLVGDRSSIVELAFMLEKRKIKYKVTDRLGLTKPADLLVGDMEYWLTETDQPLWQI